jgi:hypothetical protein
MPRQSGKTPTLPQLPSMPPGHDRPRRPQSFLARKFNSDVVRKALVDAIDQAIAQPPEGLSDLDRQVWQDGLAVKREIVEALQCEELSPDGHLRAIQVLAKIEPLHPLKATYREDLLSCRYRLGKLGEKVEDLPEAVTQGGIALRRLTQVIRGKLEAIGRPGENRSTASAELEGYASLVHAIERVPIAGLTGPDQDRVALLFRRINPYDVALTARHPKFDATVRGLVQELDAYATRVTERDSLG